MINNYLLYLLKEFNSYVIYFHNFSGFDSVFLLKYISKFNDKAIVNIVKRDDKILEISIKLNNSKITFSDSLLILPSSLEKLAKAFNVGKKVEFDFDEFNNSSLSDPTIKSKLLEYNLSDCKLLFEVIEKFSIMLFNTLKLNLIDYKTLTSISFALFKKQYLVNYKIPITSMELYNKIRPAYSGGSVNVYKFEGKDLFYYDVNSLYPYVMANNYYPTGQGIYFSGSLELSSVLGIVKARVQAPANLYVPILSTKLNHTMVEPVGSLID